MRPRRLFRLNAQRGAVAEAVEAMENVAQAALAVSDDEDGEAEENGS